MCILCVDNVQEKNAWQGFYPQCQENNFTWLLKMAVFCGIKYLFCSHSYGIMHVNEDGATFSEYGWTTVTR